MLDFNGPVTLGNSTITTANAMTIRNTGTGKVTINNPGDSTFANGNVTTLDGGAAGIVLANPLTSAGTAGAEETESRAI